MPRSVHRKGAGVCAPASIDWPQSFGKQENGAKRCPGAEGRRLTPFWPEVLWRGHGRRRAGSSHTCRQEEAAKISRWVEKGGESIKEITQRLERKVRGSEPKTAECHEKVKLSLTSSAEQRDQRGRDAQRWVVVHEKLPPPSPPLWHLPGVTWELSVTSRRCRSPSGSGAVQVAALPGPPGISRLFSPEEGLVLICVQNSIGVWERSTNK